MLVVLDSLTPAERVAFVLHDVFAVPFDEIAPIVGRTPTATRQLASRARRRVQGAPVPDVDLDGQWAVVDAFLAAARDGDFERLLAVLDPDVVLRSDGGDGASGPGLAGPRRAGRRRAGDDLPPVRRDGDAGPRQRHPRRRRLGARREPVRRPRPDGQGRADRRDRRARGPGPARASWISRWSPAEARVAGAAVTFRPRSRVPCVTPEPIDRTKEPCTMTASRIQHGAAARPTVGHALQPDRQARCWPPASRWASTGSSRFRGRTTRPAPHDAGRDHRRRPAGAGSGPRGATSTGSATCAPPAARRSPSAAGRRRSRATELDRGAAGRVLPRRPRSCRARHPVRRMRSSAIVDGVDLDDPVEAADGRPRLRAPPALTMLGRARIRAPRAVCLHTGIDFPACTGASHASA